MSCQVYSFENNDFTTNQHSQYTKQIHNLKTQIIHLNSLIEKERKIRQSDHFSLAEQIRDIEVKTINPSFNVNRVSITSSRASLTSRRNQIDDQKLNPQQDGLVVNELSRCLSQNRLSIHEPIAIENTIKQDFNLMMKQFSQFKNQIKLDIATLNDNFSDMDQSIQQCLKNIGNKGNIKVLISKVLDIEQKSNNLLNFSQKAGQEIEFIKDQVEYLTNTNNKMNQDLNYELSKVLNSCSSVRQQIETSQVQLFDCFSLKLSKIIQSYNLNFEDMDRSINEIKEVMVDVVKINKIIKQKIGLKLSNVIDNQTFQRTIQGLNQNLHSTYLLSHEKIKQINKRDFQVQNELHQMKDALDYLQSDYNYNRTRLNESITSDDNFQLQNFNDQNSTLVSQNMVSFKKKKTQINSQSKIQVFKQQNDNNSVSNQSNKSDKKMSLADELRELEMQQ